MVFIRPLLDAQGSAQDQHVVITMWVQWSKAVSNCVGCYARRVLLFLASLSANACLSALLRALLWHDGCSFTMSHSLA